MLSQLINIIGTYLPKSDVDRVAKAYHFAEAAHHGQKRMSGQPFIDHPVQVSIILAQLRQDADTLCAALLHDVLEDTKIQPEEIKRQFGETILFLIEGVTKLTALKINSREEIQAENVRKMFLAMAKDIRIVFIKLADRLHNMRTLEHLPKDKQIENSRETMDIYAPLAHRLGLGLIKWELEDLSFRYLEPLKFQEIREKVTGKRKEREKYINEYVKKVSKLLKDNNIEGEVTGRPKHFYSIYRKMQTQNLQFEDIYDLLAVRILVKSEQDCYSILGLIHAHWKPIQGKIKDYIAMPKDNMYQSLHTTVVGPDGKQVEIQIRSFEMHHTAEYGIASHWVYKETDKTKAGKKQLKQKDKNYVEKLAWLRKINEEKGVDNQEFIATLKTDLLFEEVYVFTPKGDVLSLPQGATPIDFAYQVHTDVGHHCVGAKVNSKIVNLDSELKNGDVVEVMTRKDAKPNTDWLSFVKSPRTKAKIKAWISKQNKQEHLDSGRRILEQALKDLLLDMTDLKKEKYFEAVLKRYSFNTEDDLLIAIGHGDVASRAVAKTFHDLYREKHAAPPEENVMPEQKEFAKPRKSNAAGVSVAGVDSIMIRLAHCCYAVPGDAIIGFVTMGYGITVHRAECRNVKELKERKVDVFWNNTANHKYASVIEVVGFDRVGIFKDLLNVIADKNTNVLEANARKVGHGEYKAFITIEVTDLEHLMNILAALKKVKDVYDVHRQKP